MSEQNESIRKIATDNLATLYKIEESHTLERFILTSPPTRAIVNQPEIIGAQFRNALKSGVSSALKLLPHAQEYKDLHDEQANVLHFLRGGLNFGLVDALSDTLGMNTHRSSFVTSERAKDKLGNWFIREDQYFKITLSQNSVIFAGDIVATGITIAAGFAKLSEKLLGLPHDQLPQEVRQHLFHAVGEPTHPIPQKTNASIQEIVFFTIGCSKLEETLETYHHLFKKHFKNYKRTTIIYIEGKFHLSTAKTPITLKIAGTDLLRHPATITPELFLSQYERLSNPLEACTIYDGGSRSYFATKHLKDVHDYWLKLKQLATKESWTLTQALKERWPEMALSKDELTTQQWANSLWKDIDPSLIKKIQQAYTDRWNDSFREYANTTDALIQLCNQRIKIIKSLMLQSQ